MGLITELNDDTCNKYEGNYFAFEKDTYGFENYVKSILTVIVMKKDNNEVYLKVRYITTFILYKFLQSLFVTFCYQGNTPLYLSQK